jgi:hypothetical protein
MRKQILICFLALLPLGLIAQEQGGEDYSPAKENKSGTQFFTGFSGGMMLHIGYLFSGSPDKLFSNTGLGDASYRKNLPRDGVGLGLGGALRVHMIDHIHLGAEGHVSTMPLMKTGSNVRTGWGGVLCDFYTDWGKVRPLIGLTVGGGVMKRLYVPDAPIVTSSDSTTTYNASYTKTPFFVMDPYIGMEIDLSSHVSLLIRIDYMLAFGRTNSGLTNLSDDVKWSNFMTPSGPRLYVGLMFGKIKK